MGKLGMTEFVLIAWVTSLCTILITGNDQGIIEVLKILISGYLGYMVKDGEKNVN